MSCPLASFSSLRLSPQVPSSLVVIIHSLLYMYAWYVENVHFLFVSLSQCVLMCTPGVPLTPSNVMRIVREIERWWGSSVNVGLTDYLYIPKSKQEEIRQKFADPMEQKRQSICYWINSDPLASWRRLIIALDYMRQRLDRMQQYHLAHSIRPNAEPLTGSHQIYITGIVCIDNILHLTNICYMSQVYLHGVHAVTCNVFGCSSLPLHCLIVS